MPELPEVQTIVSDLNRKIKGDTVVGFWTNWKKSVRMPVEKFKHGIRGRKITGADRIGKNILLRLSGGKIIIVHLRMTGTLIMKQAMRNTRHNKHVHHIFFLKSGRTLEFSDVRKFGSLEMVGGGKKAESNGLKNLGVDALSKGFTLKALDIMLDGKNINIKQLLMDQSKIAGLGNIYANEILFAAGISPLRKAGSLRGKERKKLHEAIGKVLKNAISLRGTSVSDYRDASGKRGGYQKVLKVYGRAFKKCAHCGTIIRRCVIGQRSSFYCPRCQT